MSSTDRRRGKTGSGGRPWVERDELKPPPVDDRYRYWGTPPPELSPRCRWWLRQIERGWRPPRRWRREGYDSSAELYGVYIYEYVDVIFPALWGGESYGKGRTVAEEWTEHERHQGKPRCGYCEQILLLKASQDRGYCHRAECEQKAAGAETAVAS